MVFPRSKRSGHVSVYSAFRLSLWTLEGPIWRLREECDTIGEDLAQVRAVAQR